MNKGWQSVKKKPAQSGQRKNNGCENCFFHIHFPWICKPQLNGGRNCPDWKDPKEGVTG